MTSGNGFETVFQHYVEEKIKKAPNVNSKEQKEIIQAFRSKVLEDTERLIRQEYLVTAKKEATEKAKEFERKLKFRITVKLICETLFLALLVGLIVNQVTALLSEAGCSAGWVIAISLILCIFFVILAAHESGE